MNERSTINVANTDDPATEATVRTQGNSITTTI